MCGIAGFLSGTDRSPGEAASIAAAMGMALRHRGPDERAEWLDGDGRLALSHRRLSIIDLSSAGSQPMKSHCGRYAIAYNGEIYNFRQLRSLVEAARGPVPWRGHSDTEALLEAIVEFGVEGAAVACKGMFAFAVWDDKEETLTLVRDRFGKKPLYYGVLGKDLAFASEVVALRRHPAWVFSPDRSALAAFLRFGYVPDPLTAFQGIHKLPAGTMLVLSQRNVLERNVAQPNVWWRPSDMVDRRTDANPARLDEILSRAVSSRLVADVPLGAFLSGGVDSTIVTALMKRLAGSVRTFAIGFSDSNNDESVHAARVAHHLGTKHQTVTLTPRDAMEIMPRVMACFDEPFADVSAIPTWLVAQLAVRDVKVVLTGDGADELFGGYTRYTTDSRMWRLRSKVPSSIRERVARSGSTRLTNVSMGRWSALAWTFAARDLTEFYRRRTSFFHFPDVLLPGTSGADAVVLDESLLQESPMRSMMSIDLQTYLPGDILTKVDRTTMAHGLEARSPFLDDEVAAFAWGLPDSALFDASGGKRILREYLYGLVPRELVERPKTGFGFPVENWLRESMRPWAESTLLGSDWHRSIGCEVGAVKAAWKSLLDGNLRLGGGIWNLLVLAMWVERQRE